MSDARRKLVVAAVAALALAALGLWLLRGETPAVAGPNPEQQSSAGEPASVVTAVAPSATEVDRTAVPVEAAPSVATLDPMLAHVRGCCVDGDGASLSGCSAKLGAFGASSNRMALQGEVEWTEPEPIVTGDDGRFDFGFVPPPGMQFTLGVTADGRVPRTGRWGRIAPAQIIDLGEIRLDPGFEVRGRVVDEQGVPVEKVAVCLKNLPLPLASDMAANNQRYGHSDQRGEFCIEVPIPPGTWSIDASSRGIRLVAPDHVTVSEHGAEPVLVTVRRMPSIAGTVVDERGQPVAGVTIGAVLNRSGRMASGRSRDDGTFTIFAVDAEPKPVSLRVDDPGPCEPMWNDERLWDWGSEDLRIELKRALSFELTVVERQGGAPVTQYAVSCYNEKARSSLRKDLRLGGEHQDGRVTVDRVWRGRNFLLIVPIDKVFMSSALIEFEAGEAGVAPMRVELERLQRAMVRVSTAADEPVTGSKVEVVRKGSGAFDADSFASDPRAGSSGFSSDPRHRSHELLGTALTGPDGRAELFVSPEASGLALRVTGQHPAAVVDPVRFVANQDLVVVVPESSSIVGRVHLAGLDSARVSVTLRRSDGQATPRRRRDEGSLSGDGSFALRAVAPGRYLLSLHYAVPYRSEHGGSGGGMDLDVPVPEVIVTAGRDCEVDIDATAIVPATLRARLRLDGLAPAPARAFVRGERGARFGQFVPDESGEFEATGLPPGTYQVGLVVGDFVAGEGHTLMHEDTFTLAAGEQLTRSFAFTRRRLVVRIVEADGTTPAASLELSVRGTNEFRRCTTDAQGIVTFDPAPAGAITLQTMDGRSLEAVAVPEGKAVHEVTLTLPAKKVPK